MTFKEKIINLRKIKGLTQDEFAKAVGVTRQAVYKWESGQSYPEVPKMLEIKLLFNISIDDLLDDSFDVPLPEKKKRKRTEKKEERKVVSDNIEAASDALKEEAVISGTPEAESEKETANSNEAAVINQASGEEKPEIIENKEKTEEVPELEKKKGFFGRIFGRK